MAQRRENALGYDQEWFYAGGGIFSEALTLREPLDDKRLGLSVQHQKTSGLQSAPLM